MKEKVLEFLRLNPESRKRGIRVGLPFIELTRLIDEMVLEGSIVETLFEDPANMDFYYTYRAA